MENKKILLIGAGGIATYLLPLLTRIVPPSTIIVADGDKFESRNLDRQQFYSSYVGTNKAKAMNLMYGVDYSQEYIASEADIQMFEPHFIMVAADNNQPRRIAVDYSEQTNVPVIIMANETRSWDAVMTHPNFGVMGSLRTTTPEWFIDDHLDPTAPCTNEEAIKNSRGQLPLANALAAIHGIQLFNLWKEGIPEANELMSVCPSRPIAYSGNGIHSHCSTVQSI